MVKIVGRVAAIAGILVSFATASLAADPPKVDAQVMRKALETYVKALNAKDVATIMGLYADDAMVEDPAGTPVKKGKAAIEAFYQQIAARPGAGPGLELLSVNASQTDSAALIAGIKAGDSMRYITELMVFNAAGKITAMYGYVVPVAAK